MHASIRGHTELCRYFIEHNADLTLTDAHHNTALHHAALHGFADVVFLLSMSQGANVVDVQNEEGETAVWCAAAVCCCCCLFV